MPPIDVSQPYLKGKKYSFPKFDNSGHLIYFNGEIDRTEWEKIESAPLVVPKRRGGEIYYKPIGTVELERKVNENRCRYVVILERPKFIKPFLGERIGIQEYIFEDEKWIMI